MNENIKCPRCGKERVIPIVYGLPSDEAFKQKEKGNIRLGGRCVSGFVNEKGELVSSDPRWYCKDCEWEWR